ncbi:hypothetical protein F66182_1762 [Fusarium sp. NRRL 66182]|nr:hypothetical protein F66182_1762 [Fusarium sp. NRRL 66182]
MSADKDTEIALQEEVKEELKDAVKEDIKEEVKEDKKEETTADTVTIAAPASSDTHMPNAPVADPPVPTPSTVTPAPEAESVKPVPQEAAASHEAAAVLTSAAAVTAAAVAEAVAEKADTLPSPSVETAQHEPIRAEPDPSKPEPAKLEPAKPETVPSEPAKPVDDFEDVPDPDEDDLDDLDDMLDEFSTVKLDQTKPPEPPEPPAPAQSKVPKESASSGKQPEVEDAFSEEEFAKQLQAGMADLLGELEKSPDMQAQFEDIFKHIAAAEGTGDAPPPLNAAKDPVSQAPPAEDASFQDTIKRTMERMQASGDQATAAAASGSGDDFMTEMLKQLSSGDLGDLGGEGSEEEFSKMLMGMMEQLTNKEILYEPMKELDAKFPEWLIKNRDSTPKEDMKRYEQQQSIVREIVAKFEEKTYSDSNAPDREFIVDRMQKMQAAGSPPSDLVGDMQSAQDALNPGDEACNPQ